MKKKDKLTPIQELNARISSTDGEIRRELENVSYELSGVKSELVQIKNNFVTKSQMGELASVVLQHKKEFDDFKQTVATKDDVNKILNHIDAFRKTVTYFDNRVEFHQLLHKDSKEILGNHEKPIAALEKAS